MKTIRILLVLIILTAGSAALAAERPHVQITTSRGEIVIELDAAKAPQTVSNFLAYAKDGFYAGTIFHRVIKGFMIQGGGMTPDMKSKPTRPPIPNEADNGLKNVTGTIAMARTPNPHSANSQFFINTKDNPFLDYKAKTPQGWGYCVFGQVIKGMDVVRSIESVQTTNRAGHGDVPVDPVIIQSVQVLPSK